MDQQQKNRECVTNALQTILSAAPRATEIARYFAPTYVQQVDGKTLDYAGFVQHMQTLWQYAAQITLRFAHVIAQDNQVATLHYPSVRKHDGSQATFMVMALFTLEDGRITRCIELTRQQSGDAADQDLGSR